MCESQRRHLCMQREQSLQPNECTEMTFARTIAAVFYLNTRRLKYDLSFFLVQK